VSLNPDQQHRYSRQLRLPQVDESGQGRLLGSSVLIVGAGGLGSPAALYLAAAGVGTIGLVDPDAVELSNLQRQILYDMTLLGRPKVEAARERLGALNVDVCLKTHHCRLNEANAASLVADYDVVVDALDSLAARRVLNAACVRRGRPLVHGSVVRFQGQASTLLPGRGPCYECLFPAPGSPDGDEDRAADPAVLGVIAPLPGVVGAVQALEALKLLLGCGKPLVGRLWLYDGLAQEVSVVRVERAPDCPVCGSVVDETGRGRSMGESR